MKSIRIYLLAILLISGYLDLSAQNYELDVRKGDQVSINNVLGEIRVEENSGSNLVVETNYQQKIPSRAKGLKPIYSNGLDDNTNLALNVSKEGKVVNVTGLGNKTKDCSYLFKIPKGVNLKINCGSPFASGKKIEVSNFSSEIEIKALLPGVKLDNVTGPVILDVIDGDVDINFGEVNQDAPTSISAIDGTVDITMPANTPANLELKSLEGEVYSNFEFEMKKPEKQKSKEDLFFEGKRGDEKESSLLGSGIDTKAYINGGGVKISIHSINNNIYLRKK